MAKQKKKTQKKPRTRHIGGDVYVDSLFLRFSSLWEQGESYITVDRNQTKDQTKEVLGLLASPFILSRALHVDGIINTQNGFPPLVNTVCKNPPETLLSVF